MLDKKGRVTFVLSHFEVSKKNRGGWLVDCVTLPETNIAPENRAPQKVTSIPTIHF